MELEGSRAAKVDLADQKTSKPLTTRKSWWSAVNVSPTGIEPATFGTGNRCSNPLSYGDIAGKIPNDVILAHGVVGD